MGHMRVRWGIALACTIAVSLAFAPARGWAQHVAPAANNKTAVTHSVTWWCVDGNDVWKVKVPAVLPIPFLWGWPVERCAKFALAAAASSLRGAGAVSSLASREELERQLDQE